MTNYYEAVDETKICENLPHKQTGKTKLTKLKSMKRYYDKKKFTSHKPEFEINGESALSCYPSSGSPQGENHKIEYVLKFIEPQITIQEDSKEDFKEMMEWTEEQFMEKVFVRLKGNQSQQTKPIKITSELETTADSLDDTIGRDGSKDKTADTHNQKTPSHDFVLSEKIHRPERRGYDFIRVKDIKEFIRLINEKVLTDWKGQNEFIDWLNKKAGEELK